MRCDRDHQSCTNFLHYGTEPASLHSQLLPPDFDKDPQSVIGSKQSEDTRYLRLVPVTVVELKSHRAVFRP
jgi:hypothetical protein